MEFTLDIVQLNILLSLHFVLVAEVLNLLLQILLCPNHFLCVSLGLFSSLISFLCLILYNLSLLEHALLETSDLVLEAFVVFLHFTGFYHLPHQVLKFFINHRFLLLPNLVLLTH